jgi:hypothetical protein
VSCLVFLDHFMAWSFSRKSQIGLYRQFVQTNCVCFDVMWLDWMQYNLMQYDVKSSNFWLRLSLEYRTNQSETKQNATKIQPNKTMFELNRMKFN